MGAHLVNGRFQSDKCPTCPRGKVPLSTADETAQDLLWEYAQRRRAIDPEFSADLEQALRNDGYKHVWHTFHRGWSACVGLPEYDKRSWKLLEDVALAADKLPGNAPEVLAVLAKIRWLLVEQGAPAEAILSRHHTEYPR